MKYFIREKWDRKIMIRNHIIKACGAKYVSEKRLFVIRNVRVCLGGGWGAALLLFCEENALWMYEKEIEVCRLRGHMSEITRITIMFA